MNDSSKFGPAWIVSKPAVLFYLLLLHPARSDSAAHRQALLSETGARFSSAAIEEGGAQLKIEFKGVVPDLSKKLITERLGEAAHAVSIYYGRFPVRSARIVIVVDEGGQGILQGTTWGGRDGFPAVTRLRIGQHTTQSDLDADWIATHELVHMALASLPDPQHWLEEGVATYVEPIARVQAGQLGAERVWADMMDGMQHGEPEAVDRGLDRTHTWGRTYWGGALFCLVADVQIREQTQNIYGLQDALKAIVAAGGTIDKDWPVERVLTIGDTATGTTVLRDLYSKWSLAPVHVDLPRLWAQLGVRMNGRRLVFDAAAPLSRIREAITASRSPEQNVRLPAGGSRMQDRTK